LLKINGKSLVAVTDLIKFMPEYIIEDMITRYLQSPAQEGMESVIYEIASYFPHCLHPHRDQIKDKYAQRAMLAGGPQAFLDELVQRYKESHDAQILIDLSRFHSDDALASLGELRDLVPEEDRDVLSMAMDNAGRFLDTLQASIYPQTYMGFVVGRKDAPHHMGEGYPYPVPYCTACEKPAQRILTLDAVSLPFDIGSGHDPSFFWYQCECYPSDYIVTRIHAGGIDGVMIPLTKNAVEETSLPAEISMQLQLSPAQHGYALDAFPGSGRHKIGGYPHWVNYDMFPYCPDCRNKAKFLVSIDSGMSAFGRLPFEGTLYGFWCEDCAISITHQQIEE